MHTRLFPAACLAAVLAATCAAAEEPVPRSGPGAISAEAMDKLLASEAQRIPSIADQQAAMDRYCEAPSLEKAAEILSFPVSNNNFTYRVGFYAQLYRQYAGQRDALIAAVGLAPGYLSRFAHCAAEWLSGDPACAEDAFLQLEYDPIMQGALRIRKNTPRPDLTRLEDLEAGIEETQLLDTAWGAYDATRDRAILCSFIRCAARTAPPADGAVRYWANTDDRSRHPIPPHLANLDLVAMAAKWSVNSRAASDAAFAAEVKECLQTLPDDVQKRFLEPLEPNPNNSSTYTPNPG